MKIEGKCPHCKSKFTANVSSRSDEETHSCGNCGYPVNFEQRGSVWYYGKGDWGSGGDHNTFHGLVCEMFEAACGSVNKGPDCYSGTYDGVSYDRLEVKCYTSAVNASVVRDAINKYLRPGDQMAIISGQPSFTYGAIKEAKTYGVHLFRVRLGDGEYYLSRVC